MAECELCAAKRRVVTNPSFSMTPTLPRNLWIVKEKISERPLCREKLHSGCKMDFKCPKVLGNGPYNSRTTPTSTLVGTVCSLSGYRKKSILAEGSNWLQDQWGLYYLTKRVQITNQSSVSYKMKDWLCPSILLWVWQRQTLKNVFFAAHESMCRESSKQSGLLN